MARRHFQGSLLREYGGVLPPLCMLNQIVSKHIHRTVSRKQCTIVTVAYSLIQETVPREWLKVKARAATANDNTLVGIRSVLASRCLCTMYIHGTVLYIRQRDPEEVVQTA
jgi:hypothetical protein